MTSIDLESCHKDRQKIAKLREKEADYISLIISEVETMINACQTQKNVSMTIKDGLKKVRELAFTISKQHQEVESEERDYDRGLAFTEEGRQARKKIRKKIEGQILRHAVLESEKQKRSRSPEVSPEAKVQQAKKKSKKKVTTGKDKGRIQDQAENSKTQDFRLARTSKNVVLVRASAGQTYASVLGKIRKEVNPDASHATVLCTRPTGKGDLLIELSSSSDREAFAVDLRRVVHGIAEIRADHKKVTLEILDLDPLADREEVVAAVRDGLKNREATIEVKLLGQNRRGLKLALVFLSEEEAMKLLKLQRVKIGLTSCRIRRRVMVTRSFRCQGFGHIQKDCVGEDRSSACYKCGEVGHAIKQCKVSAECFLCKAEEKDFGHVSGSGTCDVFRRALEAERRKERWKMEQRK